jgi:hypothetical protein
MRLFFRADEWILFDGSQDPTQIDIEATMQNYITQCTKALQERWPDAEIIPDPETSKDVICPVVGIEQARKIEDEAAQICFKIRQNFKGYVYQAPENVKRWRR